MSVPARETDPAGAPARRTPFWRAVQLVAGMALFLYALRLLAPLPLARASFVLLAALLAAGAMALSDSLVGLVAALVERARGAGAARRFLMRFLKHKGRRP